MIRDMMLFSIILLVLYVLCFDFLEILFDCNLLYRIFLILNLRFLFDDEFVLLFLVCLFDLLCVVVLFNDVL